MAGVWLGRVLLASFFGLSLGEPLYILMAPNLFRLDSSENVYLEAQGTSNTIHVTIRALIFPGRQLLSETTVELNSENKHQALKALRIPSQGLQRDSNQYAYLSADFNGNVVESTVLLFFQSGYVFVQTDKPIYNPTDTVLYRAFVTSTAATAINSSVTIEFKNPKGIVINSETPKRADNGVLTSNYKLPEVINEGIWQLIAKLDESPQNAFTTEFQVKEHVLPAFEVILKPRKKFFHVDDEQLEVEISASYVYGEEVKGSAYVVFGYEDLQGKRHTFSSSLKRVELAAGTVTLSKEDIGKDIKELVDCSIFVKATVFTQTGSDLVEAEKTGIKIVTSPYKILFTRTTKYFKPGMPFGVTVYVTNPDGSPAERVPIIVEPESQREITGSNGMAKVTVNTQGSDTVKTLIVKTQDPDLADGHQAQNQMTAVAYAPENPSSKNYLHINLANTEVEPGKTIPVFLLYHNDQGTQSTSIQFFSYLILSKGRIIEKGQVRFQKETILAVQLPVTKEMIPSFRIVAYYTLPLGSKVEIVSDSVWVDVTDTCMGKLEVSSGDRDQEYRPGDSFKLKVNGDPGAKVGLVAVDKAVFVLNSKNKLTQTKIWDEVEKKDIGCTAGGGKNSMGVFTDAGLLFQSNTGGMTTTRQDLKCPSHTPRGGRSILLSEDKVKLESQIQDEQLKICCRDGMKDIPMDYSCERRSRFITEGPECAKVFLRCCTEIANKKKQLSSSLVLSRSEKDLLPDDNIRVRTNFKESWLFEDFILPPRGDATGSSLMISKALLDTITDWEILAISSSPFTGICVSSPFTIRAKMKFFVDLRLPYAVIRNEQVEIKAVLYNYDTVSIKVRVDLMRNDEICSLASETGRFRQEVRIDGKSSRLVPFTIIPLALGEPEIEVRANVYGQLVGDAVRKKLRVLPEGVKKTDEKIVILNPSKMSGRKQVLQFDKISIGSFTPNTEPLRQITVTGDELEETIRNAISGSALSNLIRLPGGCVEQNLASMTFPVIAKHYLDKAEAWESVGVQNREKTINYVKIGYSNQLAYRFPDDSYPPYRKQAPSTWLTAYVAKVFSVAHPFAGIEDQHVCGPLKFLFLKKQLPTGAFTEEAPVTGRYIDMGGIAAGDGQVSLTAFILIATAEARAICERHFLSLPQSLSRSAGFLKTHLPTLTRPYSVAITAYALALSNQNDESTLLAHLERSGTDGTYWKDSQSHYYTLEATGYALLTYLRLKKMDTAARIYMWLIEQGNSQGGFGSTQSTMVVFQALAQFRIQEEKKSNMELSVEINIADVRKPRWHFKLGSSSQAKSEKVKLDQNFTVEATGTGRGKLAVVTEYYVLPSSETQHKCKSFDLEVSIKEAAERKAPKGTIRSYTLDICMRYLGDHDATMTILDISLPTGCVPSLEELQNLQNRVDRYIDHFTLDKQLSERGSLIIHLYKVLREKQCLSITLHQTLEVELIQPSGVTIYEYYASDIRCTKFYHPVKKQAQLGRICRDSVCRCAEESCSALKKKKDEEITVDSRLITACTATNYVFKAKLIKRNPSSSYEEYVMEIEAVLKQGDELFNPPVQRMFLSHVACREALGLREGQKYFIIGRPQDQLRPKTDTDPYIYILGSETWIEWWPEGPDCQSSEHESTCEDLAVVSSELGYGCPS